MDHTQYTTNNAERKPGKHLTREDRGAIEAMKKLGQSNRAIARYLNCSPTTVSNELKRGTRVRTGRRGPYSRLLRKTRNACISNAQSKQPQATPHM